MKKVSLVIVMIFASLVALKAFNKVEEADRPIHEIHSMMIYNFVKYIQWPEANQEFVIGVFADDDVYNTLKTWYDGKIRGDKKFIIKQFNSVADVQSCNILYIGSKGSKDFDSIKSKVASSSTLLITDKPGLGSKGSGINFKTVNGKLVFELNQQVVEQANLKVSSQLSAMATII